MIKIITTLVCAFAAIIMIILSMATNYWLQWMRVSLNTNITHYRGLFEHCWETRDNITDVLIKEDSGCDGKNLVEELTSHWNGAVVAFLVLGIICHLVAFIGAIVNACQKGRPFPSFFIGGLFVAAGVMVIIALLVFTFSNWEDDVFFSWSYGGGWSTVALSVIAFVLIMADR